MHSGPAFAHAALALLRQHDLNAVIDVGAGAGELLVELHAIEPTLTLTAIELRPRPPDLPARIGWHHELGSSIEVCCWPTSCSTTSPATTTTTSPHMCRSTRLLHGSAPARDASARLCSISE